MGGESSEMDSAERGHWGLGLGLVGEKMKNGDVIGC